MTPTIITPAAFDSEIAAPAFKKKERLWGTPAIARATGLSEDTIRRLARIEGVPITKPVGAGMYHANRTELEAWLRGKPTTTH